MKKLFISLSLIVGTLFVSAQSKDKIIKNAVSQTIKNLKIISYLRDNKVFNKPINTVSLNDGSLYVNNLKVIVPKELLSMVDDFMVEDIKQ